MRLVLLISALLLSGGLTVGLAQASPQTISYQGVLTDDL